MEILHFRAHKTPRCIVERGIGQSKRRFHVLHGEVRLGPTKTCRVICVCAMLHDLCKERNIPFHDEADDDDNNQEAEEEKLEVDVGNKELVNPARAVAQMRD